MPKWYQWPIRTITPASPEFPPSLTKIKNPPTKLWVRGELASALNQPCLAVVGARRMTSYGEQAISQLLPRVVTAGVTIVSGFMYGVDAQAHQAAINSGGQTIAVFGCGLNYVCPTGQDQLYVDILTDGGAVISEYDAETTPSRWMFPQRNRLVSGLSLAVLVVEGGEKSGSLITAKLALKQGKKLLTIPGPITSSMSRGSNWLIQNGATAVTQPQDILDALGMKRGFSPKEGSEPSDGNTIASKILKELSREPLEIDALARRLSLNIPRLSTTLSLMQLNGLIAEKQGKYYLC